jgi:hypothetical protein
MKSSKLKLKLKLRPLRPEDEVSFKNAIAAFKNETPPLEFAFDMELSRAADKKGMLQR